MEGHSIEVIELKTNGRNLIREWHKKLDVSQKMEVDARLKNVKRGNLGIHRNLEYGMGELKFSSGLRIYFGWEGTKMILLICGGKKSGGKRGQSQDIEQAQKIWIAFTKIKKG